MELLIRQLAEQAGQGTEFHIPPIFIKEFAKLIISECIDIAYEYDAPKLSGPGMIIAGRIEDRFGIGDVNNEILLV